ncbi:MAG: hypothetical protein K6A81_06050 [Clostridiales bacterium]|nr:hypothetical protein [Clostridiales bacterium]
MKLVLRRIIAIGMVFVFLASCGCAAKKKSNTIEGKGYGSPEDAALAFAEAFKEQDMDKMLSTFAIETYCSNYDAYLGMVRLLSLSMFMYNEPIAPEGASYLHEANVYNRAGVLSRNIEYLYTNVVMASCDDRDVQETYEMLFNGQQISVADSGYMDRSRAFLDAVTGAEDLDIKVGEVYKAESIIAGFYSDSILQNSYTVAKVRNADGYKSLAVSLKVNGHEMLITMDAVKYGKKWYLCSLGGMQGMVLGLNTTSAGFVSEETIEELGLLEITEYKEKQAKTRFKNMEEQWTEECLEYVEEYAVLTEGLSKQEIEELIYGDDWTIDPRFNMYSLSYEEMLEFFDIDL